MSTSTLDNEKKKTLVPQLRFQEFDGVWKEILLEDFAKRGSGHTPNKSYPEYYNGEINWISLTDSKKLDNGYIEFTNTKITQLGLNNSSAVLHPAGSVLLSRDAGVGKSAVMKHSMAVSQHFIVWSPKENVSSNWFLYNVLQILKPEFERIAIGNTIKTIGLPYFKKLKIIAPTFPEQQKIASFLSAVDEKIQQLSRKKELLEQYKKGVMQQLFSGKLRFKDENGEDYADWEEKKLGEVFQVVRGNGISKDKLSKDGANGCILYGELYTKYKEVILKVLSRTDSKEGVLSEIGDLLIPSSTTTTGIDLANITALNERNILLGGDITILRTKRDISNVFFAYFLTNHKKFEIAAFAQGSTIVHLSYNHFKGLIINFPIKEEQEKIAKFISSIDSNIESTNQQINQTQSFKKGLLQQLFV
jgi:type I restriction enzyme S subunit